METFITNTGIFFNFMWGQLTNISTFLTTNIVGIIFLSAILIDILLGLTGKAITMSIHRGGR